MVKKPHNLCINFRYFENKRHCFLQIPEKVINVDGSVGKCGKLGG